MSFSDFLRRAKSSFKFWSVPVPTTPEVPEFRLDEVSERAAKLQAPTAQETQRLHALVKLAPIPVPRAVRWESQAVYLGAWAGTAALAWGGFHVSTDWLLWYGAASVVLFAVLFRIEGPLTRAERLRREAEVQRCSMAYQQAETQLKAVLSEGFNERMDEFNALRAEYEQLSRDMASYDPAHHGPLLAQLMAQITQLEQQLLQLLDELEDYSGIHKESIDAAIMDRHNARLAYWQAKLDEAALTGETVQQH